MKKDGLLICLCLLGVLLLSGCDSCGGEPEPAPSSTTTTITTDVVNTSATTAESTTTTTQITTTQPPAVPPPTYPTNAAGLPEYVPGSIKLTPRDESGMFGDEIFLDRPYRFAYYNINGFYIDLVDKELFNVWANEYEKQNPFKTRNEMYLVAIVKQFNITREQFDETTIKIRSIWKSWGEDMSTEGYELPNADIIYTFDNEIINRFYRYE